MIIKEKHRKEIWNDIEAQEFVLRKLKTLVQNPMPIREQDLIEFTEDKNLLVRNLHLIEQKLYKNISTPTKIYFDTEFTGLHKDTTLISIGMIDDVGRTFYAELSDYDRTQIDSWLQENVINNLKFKPPMNGEQPYYKATRFKDNKNGGNLYESYSVEMYGNKVEVAKELKKWLSQYNNVTFVSDVCHYDMVLLIELFGTAFDLPDSCCPSCYDINQDIAKYYGITEKEAFNMSRERIVKFICDEKIELNEKEKHNALYDAKIIRIIDKNISKL